MEEELFGNFVADAGSTTGNKDDCALVNVGFEHAHSEKLFGKLIICPMTSFR